MIKRPKCEFEWKRKHGSWVVGKYEGEDFFAKVFNQKSPLGIDGGRISKLFCGDIEYDREWVQKPSDESYFFYKSLLDELEKLPSVERSHRERFPKMDIYN